MLSLRKDVKMINMLLFCNPIDERFRLPWVLDNGMVAATNGKILVVAPRESWDGIVLSGERVKPPNTDFLACGIVNVWLDIPPRKSPTCTCLGYGYGYGYPCFEPYTEFVARPCYRCPVMVEGLKIAEPWMSLIRYLPGVKIGIDQGKNLEEFVYFRADGNIFGAIMPMRMEHE